MSVTVAASPGLPQFTETPAAVTTSTAATFAFACTGDDCTMECSLDDAAFAACTSPLNLSDLADGSHTVSIRAREGEAVSETLSHTWKVDTQDPVITYPSPPAAYVADTGLDLTFSCNESPCTTVCSLDEGAYFVCTSPASALGLGQGLHTFAVRATDAVGHYSSPVTVAWTVDTIAPATVSDTTFTQPVSTASVTINFHATDVNAGAGFTYQCRLDGAAAVACVPGTFGPVAIEGSHSLAVTATDAAGNPSASPATITWSYWVAPETSLDPSGPVEGSAENATSATFTFTSTTGTSYECKLNDGAWETCTSPATFSDLEDGTHTVSIRAVRNGVPDGTVSTRTWIVDIAVPETTIDDWYANDVSYTSVNIEFSSDDAGATFECRVDFDLYMPCATPFTAVVETEGVHGFDVRAVDAADNTDLSPANVTWTTTFAPPATGGSLSPVSGSTLAAGSTHACAVRGGKLYCWGYNGSGQLGDITGANTSPSQMGSATDWESVSASSGHTCALRTSGALYCWGAHSSGQLGDPNTSTYSGSTTPVAVAAGQTWHKVAAIDQHTCGIRSDQSLWCWGSNSSGELGIGEAGYEPVSSPTRVGAANNWVDVTGGYAFTCALDSTGAMYCWGYDSMGQLGVGETEGFGQPMTAAATDVKSMTAGGEFACAVYEGGTLWCWGDNNAGQGGNATSDRAAPSKIGTATDWLAVEAGITHTCAIKTNGTRWCWGDQTDNALGDGAGSGSQAVPVQISSDTDWLDISCGAGFCIGMRDTAGKDVYSWGKNGFSQCGTDGGVTPVVAEAPDYWLLLTFP